MYTLLFEERCLICQAWLLRYVVLTKSALQYGEASANAIFPVQVCNLSVTDVVLTLLVGEHALQQRWEVYPLGHAELSERY